VHLHNSPADITLFKETMIDLLTGNEHAVAPDESGCSSWMRISEHPPVLPKSLPRIGWIGDRDDPLLV